MSSHVGTVTVGGFPPNKEAVAEDLGGQPASSAANSNFSFEQGKPRCLSILSYPRVVYHFMLAMYCALTYRI
jgi:hypothetical protein